MKANFDRFKTTPDTYNFDIITIPDESSFIKICTWKVWLLEIKSCFGS